MKLILDFDDVLFHNTAQFKKRMYACIAEAGIPQELAEEQYIRVRSHGFTLQKFITELFQTQHITHLSADDVCKNILSESKNFVHTDLIEVVKKLGKENCYIVTHGDDAYQRLKIEESGIGPLVKEIFTTTGSKKEYIEKICLAYPHEKILFVDDKQKHFDDLNTVACGNLVTILWDTEGFERLQAELE